MVQRSGWRLVGGATAAVTGAIVLVSALSACSGSTAVPDPAAQRAATPAHAAITPAAAVWADPGRAACGIAEDGSASCAIGACTPAASWSFDLPLQRTTLLTDRVVLTA